MNKKTILFKAKQRRKYLLVLLLLVVPAGAYLWYSIWWPHLVWTEFESKYLSIMRQSNSPEYRSQIRSWFDRDYNFTELLVWTNETLEFAATGVEFEKNTDPIKIRQSGRGACQEFSILYVAACLAHGYDCRIVVPVDASDPRNLYHPHAWAEIKLNGWVQVDPSPNQFWNQSQRYSKWPWGSEIGKNIRIYAFEDGNYEEVTSAYMPA